MTDVFAELDLDDVNPQRGWCASRVCGAPITFVDAEGGGRHPLDRDPFEQLDPGEPIRGRVVIVETLLGRVARVLGDTEAVPAGIRHVWRSHWSTCPDAAQFKRDRSR